MFEYKEGTGLFHTLYKKKKLWEVKVKYVTIRLKLQQITALWISVVKSINEIQRNKTMLFTSEK